MPRTTTRFSWCGCRLAGLLALLVLAGCSTIDMGVLRQELEMRADGRVEVGREVALTRALIERLESTVDSLGAAHLAAIDAKRQFHHIVTDRGGASRDEIIGSLPSGADSDKVALDIVEYPAGTIRIAAGDTEYSRPIAGGDWSHTGGNRCQRYLVHQTSLYCAFAASGEEVGSAPRTDVNVGIIIILPIMWTNTVRPGKLVLAERVGSSWVVRTVLDPGTDWSADETDFTIGIDQRETVHVIFRAWRGGKAFALLVSPVNVAGGSTGPQAKLRYARFRLPTDSLRGGTRTEWQEVQSEDTGWIQGATYSERGVGIWDAISPLSHHVGIAPRAGVAFALIETDMFDLNVMQGGKLVQMIRKDGWATAVLNGKAFEFLAVNGFPEGRRYWGWDRTAILRVGADDVQHLLVHSGNGGVQRMVYVRRAQDGQLAATVFPDASAHGMVRTLAIGGVGAVFAAWPAQRDRLIGRWVTSAPDATGSRP